MQRFATGTSDFLTLRARQAVYVDKTEAFVARLLNDVVDAALFCRPRRFGKTLNMTTLRAFVEPAANPEAVRAAFAGLAIERADERVWRHFQSHPVIWLSFKDVKQAHWAATSLHLAALIAEEASRHAAIAPDLNDIDRAVFQDLLRTDSLTHRHEDALRQLARLLHLATGQKPLVLIDEYDTPIHSAFEHGYVDEAVAFFRAFLGAGLKDNPHVERSVMTGILRVAKESVFSGLNHLTVHTMLDAPAGAVVEYADAFGFTQREVDALCDQDAVDTPTRDAMKAMYNGYRLGGLELYNPWSLTRFLAAPTHGVAPHWVQTSDNALVGHLLTHHGVLAGSTLEALLRGETVTAFVDEHTVLREVSRRTDALLSFLLLAGYLTVESVELHEMRWRARLRAPNGEVRLALRGLMERFISDQADAAETPLVRAVLTGNAPLVERELGLVLERVLSYHLTGGHAPERVYQAFVAGLLVVLSDTHAVTTEHESGLGRADVLVTPRRPGLPGVVMELKAGKRSSVKAALEQLRTMDYAARLREAGATPVRLMAAVFDGKRVRVGFAEG